MSLLLGFLFFYDDWGSMIAIFFTIASAFIEINPALGTEPPAVLLTQMDQRVFDDQEFTDVLKGFDRILTGEIEDPVDLER